MYRESKLKLSDFVYHDQFELSDYLSYLFHQFYDPVPNRSEDKMVKRI